MDLKSTYNKIAKDWMSNHHTDTWWINTVDKYLSFIKPNSKILDVGCGAGAKTKYLINKGSKVTGLDFSEEMIKLAKKQVPAGNFSVKDIKVDLGYKETFDGIFAQAVLLHIPKKEVNQVLLNITKPLKTGGYIYIAVKEARIGKPDEAILKESNYGYEYERFFSYFTTDELISYLKNINCETEYQNIFTVGKTNWIQIIAKKLA